MVGSTGPTPGGRRTKVPVLIAALDDEHEDTRYYAALALGEIGAIAAIPELTMILQDENSYVRSVAAESLGKIGEQTDAIVPTLIATLTDADALVRGSAAGALEKIGTPEALAALEDFDGSVLQHYHAACLTPDSAGKIARSCTSATTTTKVGKICSDIPSG